MNDERPEALLKSALEKIVYFEARSEQLENELANARAEVDRANAELGKASQREISLRRQIAELEVHAARAHREREEVVRLNEALRSERAQLLGKLIEASRIHAAGNPNEEEADFGVDLAGFISELRSEALRKGVAPRIESSQAGRPDASEEITVPAARPIPAPAPVATPPVYAPAVAAHAQRLSSEGRLSVTLEDFSRLHSPQHLQGRTEETLFGFSVRELSSPDSAARIRAAERLKALRSVASAPALATALNAESDPSVVVALLAAFSEVSASEGAAIIAPHLTSPFPEVRLAALKAHIAINPSAAGPHLSAAMKDPDASLRRRASLLALGLTGEVARKLGEEAIADAECEVRALGALVLGAGGGERSRTLLLEALKDPEKRVRQAAAQSLTRLLGENVSAVVDLDPQQRRREIRRLSTVAAKPVRLEALRPPSPAVRQMARVEKVAVAVAEGLRQAQPEREPPLAPSAVEAPSPPAQDSLEPLCEQLMTEVRCAIRGRAFADLVASSAAGQALVQQACDLLAARGMVVRRGLKYFAA